MDKLSAASALLDWFDTRLAQQRQRITDHISEVFAEINKDFATLHNGIRRIVTEDVNNILQEGAAMHQAPMSGYGSAAVPTHPGAPTAQQPQQQQPSVDWRSSSAAPGMQQPLQQQPPPQQQPQQPDLPQLQQQPQQPSAELDIMRLINERPAELQSFLTTHLQAPAAQQQQQQQQNPMGPQQNAVQQQMLNLIQQAQAQQQAANAQPTPQQIGQQAVQQVLMQLQQQAGNMGPPGMPMGPGGPPFTNGPNPAAMMSQNGFPPQGMFLDGQGGPVPLGQGGPPGPMNPGPRLRLSEQSPRDRSAPRSRSRSPAGRRARSRSPPGGAGRGRPRSPPRGQMGPPMQRVPHNGGVTALGMVNPVARQLAEELIGTFPGLFKPADFDEDLANYINENLQYAVQLFHDILEGRNTFVHRSNIRKMAAWLISEIKGMKRGRQ